MDAFDVKLDSLRNEILAETRRLNGRIDALEMKIDSFRNELLARMQGLEREVQISLEFREGLAALEA